MRLSDIPKKIWYKACRIELFRKRISKFVFPIQPKRWIFIIGCYNSGTTLLERILRRHPEIGGLPGAGVRYATDLKWPEEFGWPRMWHRCLNELTIDPQLPDAEKYAERIKREWALVADKSKENLVEKSIVNTTRIEFLNTYFKPAYFIHIRRDGYAVAEGIRRKAKLSKWSNPKYEDKYPLELCAKQWLESIHLVSRKSKKLDNFFEIKYEELTENPETIINDLANFLEISSFPDDIFEESWNISGVKSQIKNMNNKSFDRLGENGINKIKHIIDNTNF